MGLRLSHLTSAAMDGARERDSGQILCRAYSAQGFHRPLSWACIGLAGEPADADSDPGYDRARLQRA